MGIKQSPLEKMELNNLFNNIYKSKKVLLTGHTGFKGSWLALWLNLMGATVIGYSKEDTISTPNHFNLLGLDINSYIHDIRDGETLKKIVIQAQPDIIFH